MMTAELTVIRRGGQAGEDTSSVAADIRARGPKGWATSSAQVMIFCRLVTFVSETYRRAAGFEDTSG